MKECCKRYKEHHGMLQWPVRAGKNTLKNLIFLGLKDRGLDTDQEMKTDDTKAVNTPYDEEFQTSIDGIQEVIRLVMLPRPQW